MTISTTTLGDPVELATIASWLRDDLGGGLDDAEITLQSVRQDDGGWDGSAGDAFRTRMGTAYSNAVSLNDKVVAGASGIDTFATALSTAQADVEAARVAAVDDGLTVTETTILAPSAVLSRPTSPPGPVVMTADAQAYSLALSAYNTNVARWQAYATASTEVARIVTALSTAAGSLDEVQADVELVSVPASSLLATMGAGLLGATAASSSLSRAAFLNGSASGFIANSQLPGSTLHPATFYKDLDDAARFRSQAASLADDVARGSAPGMQAVKVAGTTAGVALTGLAIWMDMRAGESATQATASNAAGLAASIAAGAASGSWIGAAAGSFIPVPVAGTAVAIVGGALIGGVTGIVTSGFVDSLFENGPDVRAAVSQGLDDLVDTGKALGSVASTGARAVGGAISDAADWAGDGLSNAWDSVFG